MMFRRTLAAVAGASILLSGCGSDLPSKTEFVSQVKKSMGTDVTSSLESVGIKADKAETIMNDFIGCIYDEIKDDEDLLNQMYDDGGDKAVQANIEKQAKKCTETMTTAVTEAATAAAGA